MGRQTIEVDVPCGWRAVGYRVTQIGDRYLDCDGLTSAYSGIDTPTARIILEPEWQAPSWIKPGTWIAMELDGDWWLHGKEPAIIGNEWASDGKLLLLDYDIIEFTDFTFPFCTDWRTSKRQIGKARE